ncbi:MAG: M14 family zinc carboxypeptidase [Myxococcales bacterium]
MNLPELDQLETLIARLGRRARVQTLRRVGGYPVYGIVMGSEQPTAPCLLLVGGVHGLERIGTQVVLAYLGTLAERLQWDELTRNALERSRIAAIPLLNPVGMRAGTRSNGNGVDLMRNGPGSEHPSAGSFLVGGQRLSPLFPWYMGRQGRLEPESEALIEFVTSQVLGSEAAIALDVHSGFGFQDRLWFPYARTRQPFPHTAEMYALYELLNQTLPHHVYHTEPQSRAYTIDGDLWDYLYDESRKLGGGVFLPMTLEMGSWTWVRKNPRQVFTLPGTFNPIKRHRLRRTLRRHLLLIDFLHRAAVGHPAWATLDESHRHRCLSLALNLWFT